MKRLWLLTLLALSAAAYSPAQESEATGALSFANVAPDSASTHSAAAPSLRLSASLAPDLSSRTALSSRAEFATPEPPARPAPTFVYGARDDYRWQIALGLSLVRFRSSQYYATGVGTNTSLTYFTNEWLGVEGNINTAFAPTIYNDEHVKYVSYGAGPKIDWRRHKWEPWMHALIGGVHALPQTAGNSKNAFGMQIGGGVDYRFYPHLSARVELDWVRSHLFGEWQNSAQSALDIVLHF